MRRRDVIKGFGATAAAMAAPSIGRTASASTLRFIPQIDLSFLDPHFTPAYVTRNHGYLVFDTLYGQDANFKATPQMVAGHVIDADGKQWTLTLRDGLVWHDGAPVLARDCVASIRRWSKKDAFGGALMDATDDLSAPDDKTIRFRLKRPFPLLPDALGKSPSYMPAMMPERLAATDQTKQIPEVIGSGPYRFLANERVPGAHNAYAKFDKYVPRSGGTPDWTAGPKVAYFDRVEWTTIPDAATAFGALRNNEQDWWEMPNNDLLPPLRSDKNIVVRILDPTGGVEMIRPNHLQPPFDNPAIRRALFGAFDQKTFMEAIVGDNPSMYYTPLGIFCPNTPMASGAGLGPLTGPRDYDAVKAELKRAGYAGEKVVLLVPTDYVTLKSMADVAADAMRKAGMNVDYVATDWGTMLARRNNKGPVDKGGWSMFITGWAGLDWLNPAGHIAMRGNGEAGYPGWSSSPRTEELRNQWLLASDLPQQQAICREIQQQCMIDVPFYPLGQCQQPTAYRTSLTGVLDGFATFWNVRRAT